MAGSEVQASNMRSSLLVVITGLLILQTLLIVVLQRSRVSYKRAKTDLKRSQKALEQRVIDRTNKLRTINNQLYDEIAKHEITEELLRETQDYLHSIINSMPSILIGVTRQGYVTHWNAAAERATDIDAKDALGRKLSDVYPDLPITPETIHDAVDKRAPQISENIQHGAGSEAQFTDLTVYPLISSEVTGAVIRVDDVTMRVRIESMMIQNEKMMSLGELAAGMAHEINNPLSAILNGVQNILRRTSGELKVNHTVAKRHHFTVEQLRGYLEERDIFQFIEGIRDAGERSANIVTNMLEFSRGNSRRHTMINIAELIEHSLELSATALDLTTPDGKEEVKIIRQIDSGIPLVPCSAAEIQQVILNLLRNASQSFNKEGYSTPAQPIITLRARAEGDCVCIEIEDNGPGMIEAVRRHIFEPFFTTKEVGKGTGLGLSVSYFIVTEHHDGTIEVDSSPGRGTLFRIKLPLITEQMEVVN
ncbi:PAS domain-containing protein [Exilibacterium tricleocarpae]|uniref:histidine kinase n=2 Tax=Exilibacterium tricleocarpae TaxID=2591008 RepID=A0A545TMA9_9GAMM|nr:PAS domain-containing protein [Exilibacterium tricleocarpae]